MKEYYMNEALKEARKSFKKGETPIGAVIVYKNEIIARAHNLRESKKDVTYHAEVLAIKKACKKLKSWRLEECDIYVTLEPCIMCAGAIIQSRIKKVYIGALDEKNGAVVSKLKAFDDYNFNHKVMYETKILEKECSDIVKDFFKNLRKR